MHSTSQYHVFSLPHELLVNIAPRNLVSHGPAPSPEPPSVPTAPAGANIRTCNICLGVKFVDVHDQRSHFRSDWHRYNVKSRLTNGKIVSETHFASLVDGLDDSLSGSASSEDEAETSESDAVQTLLSKSRRPLRSPSPTASPSAPQTALAWFHSPPATQIGIYKALFPLSTPQSSYPSELKALQRGGPEGRKWSMFMVAGGHFAGIVVRVSRPDEGYQDQEGNVIPKKGKHKQPKPEMEILRHKTFHRYTTRRKQGGSQSVNDNAKGNAKSAGAQLRRYGEQALRDDIRNLLEEWADDVATSERIWLRASVANRRIFWDYEGAVIAKGDERIRTFPFPTRRPTQSELSRCLMELVKVKISHFTEDQLRAQDEAYLASLPKARPQPTAVVPEAKPEKKAPKLSKEEELLRDKWGRLLEMVKKGRLDIVKTFWERESASMGGVNATVPDWAGERGSNLLQVACHAGQGEVASWLLEELRADPTVPVPLMTAGQDEGKGHESDTSDSPLPLSIASRRTAYDLAANRAVRDVFRRTAAAHPDWWDWLGAARVPSLLSQEMEEERDIKKKVKRKGLKDKIREREAKDQQKEPPAVAEEVKTAPKPLKDANMAGPRKLGGAAGATEGIAGLTPEMRARVERERRARAAEARLKALGGH